MISTNRVLSMHVWLLLSLIAPCNLRTEANSSTSDYAIPLPPPPGLNDFTDIGADPIDDSRTGIEHGPFLPPGTPALNNIFAEAGDSHDDSPMGECM